MYLKRPTSAQIHDFILSQFAILWDEFAADRALIPPGRLVELSFEELSTDPVAAVRRVYSALGIDGFEERVRPRVEALQAGKAEGRHGGAGGGGAGGGGVGGGPTLSGYRKNTFRPLPAPLRELVARRWAAYAESWGYSCAEGATGLL